jgi:heme/copper-type cytochrome/quinol oxidase subunit 4
MQLIPREKIDHESGVAYGFFMAIGAIILAGIVLAMMAPMNNGILDFANSEIEAGHMSVQTKSAISWNVAAMVFAPVICLIVFFLWSVVRALEQKRAGS